MADVVGQEAGEDAGIDAFEEDGDGNADDGFVVTPQGRVQTAELGATLGAAVQTGEGGVDARNAPGRHAAATASVRQGGPRHSKRNEVGERGVKARDECDRGEGEKASLPHSLDKDSPLLSSAPPPHFRAQSPALVGMPTLSISPLSAAHYARFLESLTQSQSAAFIVNP